MNDNTITVKNQDTKDTKDIKDIIEREIDGHEILVDRSASKRERPWREKKINSGILSIIYENLGAIDGKYYTEKAKRLEKCGNFLEFQEMENGQKKLTNGNFCRVRLCPTCGWRRSLKIYANVSKIMDNMQGYPYIFLTLTQKNCEPEKLDKTIDDMTASWNRFIGYKDINRVVKGWYRGLEVTHNVRMDAYHPHFHAIFATDKNYFTSRDYISQKKWCELWQKAMRLNYQPIVDIRKVQGNTAKAVAEIAKYTVKDIDYINPSDLEMSENAVKILDKALDHRRLVAFGGVMKELHKQLNLDDEMDGNLENVENEEEKENDAVIKMTYAWNVGLRNYMKID